jgi:DNA mismatch repair protein MutS
MKHLTVLYDKENDALIYDRKLKDGPGNSMYGLEVCRALNLPDEFLEMAHTIRMKYHGGAEGGDALSLKVSHFNAKKIMSMCEMCNENMGKEVHHLQHQKGANSDGMIQNADGSVFHKNNVANLMTLCEKCHDNIHKEDGVMHKKVRTSKGSKLVKM